MVKDCYSILVGSNDYYFLDKYLEIEDSFLSSFPCLHYCFREIFDN